MTKYFKDVQTLEQLRKQYRDLLKKFHPDNENGSEEITKTINTEYEQLFKILKDKHESRTTEETGHKHSYNKYNFEDDEQLRMVLQKIIHFEGITIEIIGDWIWTTGNTYPYKKELKALGFKWASQKRAWYWHGEGYIRKTHKNFSMNEIRDYFGSTEVKTDEKKKLATA